MSKKLCVTLIVFLFFHSSASQAANVFSSSLEQAAAKQAITPAQELQRLRTGVQAKLDELYKSAEFPGATVGFILADGRFASVSAGFSDLETRTPLHPTDKMLAGSIGKTYFAAVVMQLVQEGKLKLDEKIDKWFRREPWFARLPNANDITVRMLMNHTSGLAEYYELKGFIDTLRTKPDLAFKPEILVECVLDSKPLFAAGQDWSYADTNYILVGMIVERITGKSLYSEVEKRILKPLKLTRTIPSNRRTLPGVITGYSMPSSPFGFEGPVIKEGKFIINPQFEWAGGGYASTAEELARWAKALYESKVFKPAMLEQMLTAVPAKTGRGDKYGLGVQVRQSNWGISYGHGGWFPGYNSEMEYFPEHKVAIAIQINTDERRKMKKGLRAYIADIAKIIIGKA
jgi:D-alanyl-D-alanine carboxypeptidase